MMANSSAGRPCRRSSRNSLRIKVSDSRGNRLTRTTIRWASVGGTCRLLSWGEGGRAREHVSQPRGGRAHAVPRQGGHLLQQVILGRVGDAGEGPCDNGRGQAV